MVCRISYLRSDTVFEESKNETLTGGESDREKRRERNYDRRWGGGDIDKYRVQYLKKTVMKIKTKKNKKQFLKKADREKRRKRNYDRIELTEKH